MLRKALRYLNRRYKKIRGLCISLYYSMFKPYEVFIVDDKGQKDFRYVLPIDFPILSHSYPSTKAWLRDVYRKDKGEPSHFQLWLLSAYPHLLDELADIYIEGGHNISYPREDYDTATSPTTSGDKTKQRSILFIHHCYYNFYYLAQALRKRGWDAMCVSVESPNSPNYQFYHGEDLNLFDEDPAKFEENVTSFFNMAKKRFRMVHFYGAGSCSFFPKQFDRSFNTMPWDFLELKRRGVKIGYSHSGCNDLVKQSVFYEWSGGSCERCIWKDNPAVCSDKINGDWGLKLSQLSDLICVETEPTIDYKGSQKVYYEPLTFAVDSDVWSDQLEIPAEFKIDKKPGEFLVYHSVGNYKLRTKSDINFKGTEAVMSSIQRLQQEGYPVKLIFVDGEDSRNVRFIQAQCDLAIDQLNYGRYGANARELMMLGIPLICNIEKNKPGNYPLSKCIADSPIINADIDSIYDVLKYYVENQHLLPDIKKKMRQHALEWWAADKCAERFEKVYDALMDGSPYNKIRTII